MDKMESIIKKYGRGYYRSTFLFPKQIREATWVYYTFVRLPDEIVDNAPEETREAELNNWISEWNQVVEKNVVSENEILNQFKKIMSEYNIPVEYSYAFFKSMKQDLTVTEYDTYEQLEDYMYGSSVVVGYTMSSIIGYQEGALEYAKALAEAFQMTNFIRDIQEDYELRKRIYIPKEDIERFGVTIDHIAKHNVDTAWQNLIKFEIQRTRQLYEKGLLGIPMLHARGRRAVYAAALIYKDILDKIEKQKYDVFSKRVKVSAFRKTMLLYKALWKKNL